MNKKLVAIVVVLILLSFAVYVSAWAGELYFDFDEGWNLVYGLGDIDQLEGQTLENSSIKAIFAFIPTTQEYAQMYPNPDYSKINLINDDELMNTAFFVYSEKGALSEYWLAEESPPLKDRQMYAGWNFVGITPDMAIDANIATPVEEEKYTLNAMKGDCNILKAYFFDNEHQKWVAYSLDQELDKTLIGFGILIKVSQNCKMKNPESLTTPPPLPIDPLPQHAPEYCIVNAPFGCDEFSIDNQSIRVVLRNSAGEQLTASNISLSGCTEIIGATTLPSDGTVDLTFTCTPETRFKGDLVITYKKAGSVIELKSTGSVSGNVI